MVTLDDRETQAVRKELDKYLPELQYELARIKLERDRHELVALEETLSMLRQRLDGLATESAPPPPRHRADH